MIMGMFRDHRGNVVVEQARQVVRVLWLGPVAEHHRYGGEHLHTHAGCVTFPHPHLRIPAVCLDFSEEFAVLEQACAAGAVVLQLDEAAVAVAFFQVRPVLRKNMSMYVDLKAHYLILSPLSGER